MRVRGIQFFTKVAFLVLISSSALAGPALPERKDPGVSLKGIESRLQEKRHVTEDLSKKAKQLSSDIDKLQQDLVASAGQVQKQEKKLNELDRQLLGLKAKKAIYADALKSDHQSMTETASALQKLARMPPETLLLKKQPPLDTARGAMILQALLPKIQQRADDYGKKLNEINIIEDDIEEKLETQTAAWQELSRKRTRMRELMAQRTSIYQITIGEQKKHEADISFLTKQARSLKDLFARLEAQQKRARETREAAAAAATPRKKTKSAEPVSRSLPAMALGSLRGRAPVEGSVVTGFGQTDELGAKSEGITISARAGATVTAPLAGTVRFAGPFQKYRQILIIEHPGGYHSLIAGLGRIDTVVGARLASGEPVGALDTGAAPRLYFELRHDGKPVNPQPALLAQGN